jgi:hypothetical protein
VDDEESQRTALAGMIAVWGYAEETAADGAEAAADCEFVRIWLASRSLAAVGNLGP